MTTFTHCDFDTYVAIEEMVFAIFSDESDLTFEDVVAFAADHGVEFTEWDWTSLGIDFDEM
jgi:hypothetical protein